MTLDPPERRRLELSLEATESALHRLETASFRKSRWKVAATLLDRAITLVCLERFEEGLAGCNEVLRHFGDAQDGPTQMLLAGALRYKREALGALSRPREAREVCQEVIRRFAQSPEEILAHEVADAQAELAQPLILDAGEAELDRVTALILRSFAQYHPLVSSDFWQRFDRDVAEGQPRLANGQLIIAELTRPEGTILAGTVTFYPNGSRYPMPGWPQPWCAIRLLAVAPEARRLGIGRRLVAECVARAERAGAEAVGLHTGPFMAAARSLYRSLGFERVPEYDVLPPDAHPAEAFRRLL